MFIPCYMLLFCKMHKSTLDLVKALALGCGSRYYYNIMVTVKICFVETIAFSDQSGDVRAEESAHEESSGNISKQKSREQ